MPKDVSGRHSASDMNRYHAYKPLSRHGKGHEIAEEDAGEMPGGKHDWEDATCPICMDHPHNAVLLLCSSHENGCRPYMCNTSYRHSNCFDQYQKAHWGSQKVSALREPLPEASSSQDIHARSGRYLSGANGDSYMTIQRSRRIEGPNAVGESVGGAPSIGERDGADESEDTTTLASSSKDDLVCPLCRGNVQGWKVVVSAREHLNQKAKNCAQESCLFSGNYEELRMHARQEHPLARPSEVNPDRQRKWRQLERRRHLGDVYSSIGSSVPGATLVGDFLVEDNVTEEDEEDFDFPGDNGHLWTVFVLFHVFGPAASVAGEGISSPGRVRRQVRVPPRGLQGESLSRDANLQVGNLSESSDVELHGRRAARRRRIRRRGEELN